jgi:hypothetical protein
MKRRLENKKTPRDAFLIVAALLALIFICVPLLISFVISNGSLGSADGLGNDAWLRFGGSYMGSALGVMVTFIAFAFTYRQNEKQSRDIQEQNKIIQEQNAAILQQNTDAQSLAGERRRLQALPFINVRKESISDPDPLYKTVHLDYDGYIIEEETVIGAVIYVSFRNIGVGPAIDWELSGESLGHLPAGDSSIFALNLPLVNYMNVLRFEIRFCDREFRKYRQVISLKHTESTYDIAGITPPEPV